MIFRTCKSGKPKSHVRHVKPVFMRVYKNLRTCRTSRTLPFYLTAFLTDRQEVEAQRLREEYEGSNVIRTVKKLVEQGNGHWEGSVSDIIEASKYFQGCQIYDNERQAGKEIRRFERQLKDIDAITYRANPSRKTGKRELTFESENPFLMSPMSPLSSTSPLSPRSEEDIKDNVGDMKQQ